MRFLPGNNQLYPFEARVIESIKSRLDSDGARRLQAQIDSINKVQRITDGEEVNLYRVAHGKPAFDDSLRFPQVEEEALLGTVHLALPGNLATLKCEAWLASGRLFSLVFDKPPERFFAGHALHTVRPEVAEVTVWMDPIRGRPKGDEVTINPATLRGWPQEFFLQPASLRPHDPHWSECSEPHSLRKSMHNYRPIIWSSLNRWMVREQETAGLTA